MLLLTWVVVLLTFAKDVSAGDCPDGWVNWSNNCYIFVSQRVIFANAKNTCAQMSAHLISIHSWEEGTILTKNKKMTEDHWLGIRRNTTREGTPASKYTDWHWLDGTTFNFFNWVGREPDSNAQCAVITPNGTWGDEYCTRANKFICKKVLTQPTTTTKTTTVTIPTTTTTTTTTTTPTPTITTTTSTTVTTTTTIIPPTTTTTSIISSTKTTSKSVPSSSALDSPGLSTNPTDHLTMSTTMSSAWLTTGPLETDWMTRLNNVTATSQPPQSSLFPSTPRQERQAGKGKTGVGLYIGVAAGCIVIILAVVVAVVALYRRKRKHPKDSDFMSKPYVAADGEYVYARNDTPDTIEADSPDNNSRRSGNRLHSPYETIQMEDTNANSVNSGGQTFDATPSDATLNGDQQRIQSPKSANYDNTDQDIADMYAVPMKKKNKRTYEEQTPETPPDDETEIEHEENDLYQIAGDDNEEFVDDDIYVVENDIYDQCSVVL